MKKLDVRFDTVSVNKKLDELAACTWHDRSKIARAAMNIGLAKLKGCTDMRMVEVIDGNLFDRPGGRVIESAIVKREIVK